MLKIRRARLRDIDGLTDIIIQFHKYFQTLNGENQEIQRNKIATEIQSIAFGTHPLLYIFVAETNGKIIGAAAFYRGWTTDCGLMYHIPYLFVNSEFRGSRVVFALLGHIKDIAKKTNVHRFCFSVYGKNAIAKRLYEHIGAKYWAAAEDEHFMFYDF
jgi:N-acetylglutamate synthase-like GNAT family acetyltransferase